MPPKIPPVMSVDVMLTLTTLDPIEVRAFEAYGGGCIPNQLTGEVS
jgi:hypothetical protein